MRIPVIPKAKMRSASDKAALPVKWRGRSGRYYALFQEHLDNFVLESGDLYVIAEGDRPRWIGTAGDLIEDQTSRARFRAAVKVASTVLRLTDVGNDLERMTAVWDIEGGHLAGSPAMVMH
jgi:hypothetical protein